MRPNSSAPQGGAKGRAAGTDVRLHAYVMREGASAFRPNRGQGVEHTGYPGSVDTGKTRGPEFPPTRRASPIATPDPWQFRPPSARGLPAFWRTRALHAGPAPRPRLGGLRPGVTSPGEPANRGTATDPKAGLGRLPYWRCHASHLANRLRTNGVRRVRP